MCVADMSSPAWPLYSHLRERLPLGVLECRVGVLPVGAGRFSKPGGGPLGIGGRYFTKHFVVVAVYFLGHALRCSRLTPVSALRDHS